MLCHCCFQWANWRGILGYDTLSFRRQQRFGETFCLHLLSFVMCLSISIRWHSGLALGQVLKGRHMERIKLPPQPFHKRCQTFLSRFLYSQSGRFVSRPRLTSDLLNGFFYISGVIIFLLLFFFSTSFPIHACLSPAVGCGPLKWVFSGRGMIIPRPAAFCLYLTNR